MVRMAHTTWKQALRRGVVSGSIASIASGTALAACGKRELDDPAAPLNGPSQWLWGERAACADGFSLRHTLAGYAVHHAMSIFWAVLYEKFRRRPLPSAAATLPAIATSTGACVVDYCLTPKRLTPGFEKRLSRGALLLVYAAFAAGLAVSTLVTGDSSRR
jgi:hypothetical protein